MQKKPEDFIRLCIQSGIPAPSLEWRFHAKRKWRIDYAWPEKKVGLEVEGGVWKGGRHNSPQGFAADMVKYNNAAAMGWRILKFEPKKLCTLDTILLVKEALQ